MDYDKIKSYLKMPIDKILTLNQDKLKYILETLVTLIEYRITEKKQTTDTIVAIKNNILTKDFFERDALTAFEEKILNHLLKMWKQLSKLTYKEKVELFIEYADKYDIPTKESDLKFSDLKETIFDDSSIYEWYQEQIQENKEMFDETVKEYKKNRAVKLANNSKERTLEIMIYCFMNYLETNEIPNSTNPLTFSDIGLTTKNTKINSWLRNCKNKKPEQFLSICQEYKNLFPTAHKKIEDFWKNYKTQDVLNLSERVTLFLKFLETHDITECKKLTFNDLDPTSGDFSRVINWFDRQRTNFKVEFLKECKNQSKNHPISYKKLMEHLGRSEEYKQKYTISMEDALEIYMQYINEHDLPGYNSQIRFKDISSTTTVEIKIYSWSFSNVFTTKENVLKIVEKYKSIYPYACQKILSKIEELEIERERNKSKITEEEKIKVLMKFLETNAIPNEYSDSSFYQICSTIKDQTKVGSWIRDRIFRNKEEFLKKCSEYKDIYPTAYKKIEARINRNEDVKTARSKIINYTRKIEILMEYYDGYNEYSIDENLRFCDLDSTIGDESPIYNWLKRNLSINLEKFNSECQKYKDIYPIAYNKIKTMIERIKTKRSKDEIEFQKLNILMEYLEENDMPTKKDNITFAELSPSLESNENIIIWLNRKLENASIKFIQEITNRQKTYPTAFEKLKLQKLIVHTCKKMSTLTYEEKVQLLMEHLESKGDKNLRKLRFCDISTQTACTINVGTWLDTQIKSKIEQFLAECSKYKFIYPNAYKRIEDRKKKSNYIKQKVLLPPAQRFQILMYFLETNDFCKDNRDTRFCDLCKCEDTSNLYSWYSNSVFHNLHYFIIEISKYKDIYPNAYLKICAFITGSKKIDERVHNERILLIEILKNIKADFNRGQPKVKKKVQEGGIDVAETPQS